MDYYTEAIVDSETKFIDYCVTEESTGFRVDISKEQYDELIKTRSEGFAVYNKRTEEVMAELRKFFDKCMKPYAEKCKEVYDREAHNPIEML